MSQPRNAGRARAVLAWGLIAFFGVHLAVTGVMERGHPEVHDPEHFYRLALLHARLTEQPDASLLLLVGSSRTMMAFQPEALPALRTGAGRTIVPFNYSHTGAGPLLELVVVRRLLREGVRPDWLMIEVMPAYLAIKPNRFVLAFLGTADWPVMKRYLSAGDRYGQYVWNRWLTELRYHRALAQRFLPRWIQTNDGPFPPRYGPLGGYAALWQEASPERAVPARTIARQQYAPIMQHYRIDAGADRALRELLELSRRERIRVVLLVTPEGSEYRGWYSPRAHAEFGRYLASLVREHPVPVIDAREWLRDDAFYDGHHVLLRGAQAFTRRLADELPHLLESEPAPSPVP